jgi:hypothetical protein
MMLDLRSELPQMHIYSLLQACVKQYLKIITAATELQLISS